jgi:hypothetical protein
MILPTRPRARTRQPRADLRLASVLLLVGAVYGLPFGLPIGSAAQAAPPAPAATPAPQPSAATKAGVPTPGAPDEGFLEFLGSDDVGDTALWEYLKKAPPTGSSPPATAPQDAKK